MKLTNEEKQLILDVLREDSERADRNAHKTKNEALQKIWLNYRDKLWNLEFKIAEDTNA